MPHAGLSPEEAVRAKASWGAERIARPGGRCEAAEGKAKRSN